MCAYFTTQVVGLVDIMRNPSKYQRLGARQPTGLLLVGPPGTGLTHTYAHIHVHIHVHIHTHTHAHLHTHTHTHIYIGFNRIGETAAETLACTRYCFTSSRLCTSQSSFHSSGAPALPTLLQHYCTAIGQHTTPPLDLPLVCHTPYYIGKNNIV